MQFSELVYLGSSFRREEQVAIVGPQKFLSVFKTTNTSAFIIKILLVWRYLQIILLYWQWTNGDFHNFYPELHPSYEPSYNMAYMGFKTTNTAALISKILFAWRYLQIMYFTDNEPMVTSTVSSLNYIQAMSQPITGLSGGFK
jgi:hypothetical protein